jgi:hypothetical protein
MNEMRWRVCDDPVQMLAGVRDGAGHRRLRLFACGCCRVLGMSGPDSPRARAVEVAERHADARAGDLELRAALDAAEAAEPTHANEWPWKYVCDLCFKELYVADPSAQLAAGALAEGAAQRVPERDLVCAVLRDIFGNPFRPVAFDPAWRTEHTAGIASKMYEERDFAGMLILADALEDAGCDNLDILGHCRGPGPHVLGCWVVDQLLKKE